VIAAALAGGPEPLRKEWQRIEALAHCAARLRQGERLEPALLDEVRALQEAVLRGRNGAGAWRGLGPVQLAALEYDVLACVVAPEVEPRIGWFYQTLQPGVSQPYPSAALVQELLAIGADEAAALRGALAEDAPLRRLRLIDVDEPGPFQPIRPACGVAARLVGAPEEHVAPPGTVRFPGTTTLAHLVLPPDRVAMIRELLAFVRERRTVVEAWGGRSLGGPVALFCGPSGTGKTLAAAAIAGELGWPLYRADLGALVSKYIGETEKNLNRVFAAAHGRAMVLLFDEADALFGKRGDVKDARDRYANMEVGHLLSRIELHDGPCILTTNLREHLDGAFARRFQLVVDFPRPDAASRALLWERLLPPRAPRTVEVEPRFLAGAVPLSGGGIRNAALHAAYLAATSGRPIGLPEVALAVYRELSKDGRPLSRADLGALAPHLPKECAC